MVHYYTCSCTWSLNHTPFSCTRLETFWFLLRCPNQILEKVDMPLCERPKRPDHCPKEIHNILLSHCWAHEPHQRARFSMLKKMVDEVRLQTSWCSEFRVCWCTVHGQQGLLTLYSCVFRSSLCPVYLTIQITIELCTNNGIVKIQEGLSMHYQLHYQTARWWKWWN